MILIDKEQQRFNYRIAGVVIQNCSVLVHQADGDDFWTLPGGRAEIGESAERTLMREMVSARRIYEAVGFKLVAEEKHHSFGHDLVGQNWDLQL